MYFYSHHLGMEQNGTIYAKKTQLIIEHESWTDQTAPVPWKYFHLGIDEK